MTPAAPFTVANNAPTAFSARVCCFGRDDQETASPLRHL